MAVQSMIKHETMCKLLHLSWVNIVFKSHSYESVRWNLSGAAFWSSPFQINSETHTACSKFQPTGFDKAPVLVWSSAVYWWACTSWCHSGVVCIIRTGLMAFAVSLYKLLMLSRQKPINRNCYTTSSLLTMFWMLEDLKEWEKWCLVWFGLTLKEVVSTKWDKVYMKILQNNCGKIKFIWVKLFLKTKPFLPHDMYFLLT